MRPTEQQKAQRLAKLNKNVPKDWKPVEAFEKRPSRMMFSDRLFYWFLMVGGILVTAAGVGLIYLSPLLKKPAFVIMALGFIMFCLSTPSMAARHGYRH